MIRTTLVLLALAGCVSAETRTLTLRETIARALQQNPELVIARFDQVKAQAAIQVARDPFIPKVIGGSGAAWTTGYPASINGQPPSIFQATTQMSIYNKPQSYHLAQVRENARGADVELAHQQDEAVYRAATLWLDAQHAAQAAEVARQQLDPLRSIRVGVQERLREGRALPVDLKQANLDFAKAEQRAEGLLSDQESAELALAVVLGYGAEDRVSAAKEDRLTAEVPASEETSVESAIANSKEIKVLESRIQAKGLEVREYKSARLPSVEVVAQYNLLAEYNFQDFFRRFQRHNGQLGAAITIPLLVGSAAKGYMSQAEADLGRLHAQVSQVRGQIALNTRKNYQLVRKAERARRVAQLDLDVTREKLSVLLAQYEEGRTPLRDVEQLRIQESEKWIAFDEALHSLERVKVDLLRQTGTLIAALE